MQDDAMRTTPGLSSSTLKRYGTWIGAIVGITLLCSALLPGVPIVLGVFLMLAAVLHAWSPELQPLLQPLLRVPVADVATRRTHLLLVGAAGLVLLLSGAVGARTRGHLRSAWQQGHERRAVAEQDGSALLERAREYLTFNDVQNAELALMDAAALADLGGDCREEVEDLLARVRRSGDAPAILDAIVHLSNKDFEALESSRQVPEALEYPERALTLRAVEIALAQLDEARRLRASR